MAPLVATATAAFKRRVIVYGLWVASGLLVLFAAGYVLNALYTLLMFRWGAVAASLAVGGGLLLSAIGLALVGYVVSRAPHRSMYQRLNESPALSRTTNPLAGAAASAGAGALAGAVAVFTLLKLRGLSAARGGSRYERPDRGAR